MMQITKYDSTFVFFSSSNNNNNTFHLKCLSRLKATLQIKAIWYTIKKIKDQIKTWAGKKYSAKQMEYNI